MNSEATSNRGKLWGITAAAGIIAFLALKVLAGYPFVPALILAILIGILVAILLWIGIYRDAEQDTVAPNEPHAIPAASDTTASASRQRAATAKSKTSPKKAAAKSKPAKPTAKKISTTKSSPVAKDGQPPLLKKPRTGGADDLKQIDGVGPALEKTLNRLGFFHFDQIAAWRKKEIHWVDARLKFKGRIERDGWVKQCKTLAKSSPKT